MAAPFEPARLRLAAGADPAAPAGPPRHRPGEMFLKGPVPWPWVLAAAKLPGKALAVGLAVWLEAGMAKSRTVAVTLARLAVRAGTNADAVRRAIRVLERAGLVTVTRAPGRGHRVTLNDAPETARPAATA